MTEEDKYKTIGAASEGIYKEKGSKFLAFAYPVSDKEAIQEHIQAINKEYFDARHRCYAWKLGLGDENYRANDDGEPSGTAGKPILGQILSNELTNILIVVVRYFGGIKLGTGGLINAYRTASSDAIANAEIVSKFAENHYTVIFSYLSMNDVMKVMKSPSINIKSQNFDTDCSMQFSVRQSFAESVCDSLRKITSVKISFDGSF